MNRSADIVAPVAKRSRAWLVWIIVLVAGAAIGASFLVGSDDDAAGKPSNGPRTTTVTAVAATRGEITERGRYPGELDADSADVSAFYAGRLVAVNVRVGDTVAAGDVLAVLDPVDAKEQIAQARAQAKAAEAEERRARVDRDAAIAEVARLEPLAKDKLIAELEIDKQRARAESLKVAVEAAAAGGAEAKARVNLLERRVIESRVRAPFAGRIAERYVDPGTTIAAGARLVRLVQVAPLRIRFEVPEQDVPGVAVGTQLRVVTKARAPGATNHHDGVAAKVTGIGSEVSRERRVANVEALIENPPPGWLPGMYAEAVVDRQTLHDATLVPAPALLSRLQPSGALETGLFVATEGIARWTPVTVAARDGDRVAVTGALTPGAQVLIAGHVDLTDGSRVRVAGAAPP